uniref:Stabilizer of axonemal microtubules 4 n=1 Tax=Myripristis murdjan TaxID=586833 RepID=A0A668ANI0_9TELE
MAEQGKIVTPTVGATGIRGRLTSSTLSLCSGYNKASYGEINFTPCLAHHSATGYSSNLRPAIYYKPSLDLTDNPRLGLLLSDNFISQTKRDYQPYTRSDGSEASPNLSDKARESGYLQLGTVPKRVSVLLQTEYEGAFVPHRPAPTVSRNHVTVGRKGESSFIRETACEPNTFLPKNSCLVGIFYYNNHQTCKGILCPSAYQGTEALPNVGTHTSRETGFTRNTTDPLACSASLLPSSQTKNNAPTERFIGRKESSGFVLNEPGNQTFPNTPFDRLHFLTHYQSKFCDRAAVEKLRSGSTWAGINNKRSNGFTRRATDR